MKSVDFFGRMSLDELVQWYNENVAVNAFGPFNEIMAYNEENLMRVAEYCGIAQYTDMIIGDSVNRTPHFRPKYFLYDTETDTITTYSSERRFKEDFLEAMIEEYENQNN